MYFSMFQEHRNHHGRTEKKTNLSLQTNHILRADPMSWGVVKSIDDEVEGHEARSPT